MAKGVSKDDIKAVTLKDLITKKQQILDSKLTTKKLYVESLDGSITVKKPTKKQCMDALDMDTDKGDMFLVYECVVEPNLKDTELRKQYACIEPYEIVEKIFEAGEISNIAKELVKMCGYIDSVKEIKN